jgi:uncharacterized protein (DUF58 family)
MRPNRHTFGLAGVLLSMWYAGASQNNAAAYLLGFLTLSVAAVSAVHAWSNLRGLQLTVEPILPVYEEEPVVLKVRAKAEPGRRHLAVRLQVRGSKAVHLLDCVAEDHEQFELLGPTRGRGRYREVDIIVSSTFPLGFFTAQRVIRVAQEHYVYPKPAGALPLPTDLQRAREAEVGMTASEGDDFAGVSEWHPGQSMRHVDWKAVARGQRLMVKQWSGRPRDPFTFSWDKLEGLATEDRLRQLARWLVLTERLESPYGLELPGATMPISRGDAHFHQCLRMLAEFPA